MSRWYIIHAYSGFENKVKETILSEARRLGPVSYTHLTLPTILLV